MMVTSRKFSNEELGDIFKKIADLLEIKGEIIYKTLAYRKASDGLYELDRDINEIWQEGKLNEIPGVGKAIAEKIDELLTTGKLEFLIRLEQEVPPTLVDILLVPDIGPKKVALFWKQAGITTLPELEIAAQQGKLRLLPGMGEKSEAKILSGIEAMKRRMGTSGRSGRVALGKAWPFTQNLLDILARIARCTPGGSSRQCPANACNGRGFGPGRSIWFFSIRDESLHEPPGCLRSIGTR